MAAASAPQAERQIAPVSDNSLYDGMSEAELEMLANEDVYTGMTEAELEALANEGGPPPEPKEQ